MKLIVFGASGGTGQQLLKQALEQGHEVTAFVRNPGKLQQVTGVKVTQGDVLDPAAVSQAVADQEAVLCALGRPNILDKSNLRAKGTRNIIDAMEQHGVRRLVCMSSFGTDESFERLPFEYKYLLVPLVMKHLYQDHLLQEHAIKQSKLEWVIVRPGVLTNGKKTDNYRQDCDLFGTVRPKIARADVSAFMLQQLESNEYRYKTPAIYY